MQDYELHRYDCERLVKGSGPDGRYAGTPCTCSGREKMELLEDTLLEYEEEDE